jgi:GTP-binding protein
MQFIDEATIYVKAGDGGNGCSSFRREKFVPRGGPNGGDGGNGGNVIVRCIPNLNTLKDFRYKRKFIAQTGQNGKGSEMHGRYGDDLVIGVPLGTQLFFEDEETLYYDFNEIGQEYIVAKGGNGGWGNVHFKTSVNQAPRKANLGLKGEEFNFHLKLKLLSDAGLIGLPNAGKSTFLSVVTSAKPKIANYPFTTLKPKLGVVYIDDYEFVLADLPGLIEGASEGKGLGHRFLKHIERCGILIHMIDLNVEDVAKEYKGIRAELENYNKELVNKKEIIVLNKIDSLSQEEIKEKRKSLRKIVGTRKKIFEISGVTGQGVKELLREIKKEVMNFKGEIEEE